MEILDLYDAKGNLLNKTIERGNKNFCEGEYIKLATVWLRAGDKYLIQECSEEKGGEFAVSGGHVPSGKTSREQAIIEMQEELGLDIDAKNLKFLGSLSRGHGIFDVYMFESFNLLNRRFILQEEEVKAVYWLTTQQIRSLIYKGKLRKSTEEQFNKFINDDLDMDK